MIQAERGSRNSYTELYWRLYNFHVRIASTDVIKPQQAGSHTRLDTQVHVCNSEMLKRNKAQCFPIDRMLISYSLYDDMT